MKHNTLQSTQKGTPYALFKSVQQRLADSPRAYLGYCFLLPAIIMYLVYVAMEIHPFGNGTVLVLDLNGQYVYFFEALREVIWGDGSLLYSFVRNLGGEFVGIYAYYLASPLSYIVALFPKAAMQEAMLTLILIKVGLCGLSFGWYLHKHTAHPSKPVVVSFSVLYALSAYAVIYQSNVMWIDALCWLPVLTYSIEQLIQNRRYKLFVVSLALTVMSNYYIGYMVCVYTAVYFFYYLFAHSPEQTNPHGEKHHKLRALARIAIFSAIALAISAFIILGAYYSLSFGKNEFSNPNWSFTPKFEFLDLFTKFLPSTYDTVRPEGLPLVYCGILTLFLIPIYFLSRKIAAREKIASLLLIALFVASFICRPLDLVWHGFQAPNWLNYRYSFMLIFILLVLAYKGFGNLKSVGSKFIFGTTAMLILFVSVCAKQTFETYVTTGEKLLTLETVWLSILAAVAIGTLLCLLAHAIHPKRREALAMILMAVVCVEVFCSSLACVVEFDDDVSYATYSSYDEFLEGLRPIVDSIEEYDPGFYRAEKIKHRKYNDNMALGLRGLSGSTSTLNSETLTFLNRMGYASRSHLSQYLGGNPVNDSLLGVRYIIDENKKAKLAHYGENKIAETELYTAYQNPYALSLAYGVDASITEFDISGYDTHFERLNALVGTMLGDETSAPLFQKITNYDTKLTNCTSKISGATVTYTEVEDSKEDGKIVFTFIAPQSAEYYFHPPAKSRPKEVKVAVGENVKSTDFVNYLGSNRNSILSLGYFEKGEKVTLNIKLKDDPLKIYVEDYFWYLDDQVFADSFDQLLENPQFIISDTSTDDHLTGTLRTNEQSQMILTTIPYDEGWNITLNGQPVEIYKTLDALIAFDVDEAGEYTLEMKYMPRVYRVGLIISGLGLLSFLAICVADECIRRSKKKHNPQAYALLGEPWILTDFDEDAERAREYELRRIEPKPLKQVANETERSIMKWYYGLFGMTSPKEKKGTEIHHRKRKKK